MTALPILPVLPDRAYAAHGLQAPPVRVPIPGSAQSFSDFLDPWLATRPHAEALVGRHARYDYAGLEAALNAAAAALRRLGVRAGDRVAATTGNHPDIVIAFLAVQRLGAIWVGINRNLAVPEKTWMLAHAGVTLLLADQVMLDQLAGHLPADMVTVPMNGGPGVDAWQQLLAAERGAPRSGVAVDPWAPAMISFTSGTTGRPKGVVHSQHNAVLLGAAAVQRGQWDIGLRRGSGQPLTITNIMIRFATASLYAGASFVCMDRLDAAGTVEWVVRERIQAFSAVPTMIYDLLFDPAIDLASMATLVRPIVGGSGLPENVLLRFRERFGTDLQFSYGLTEAPTGVAQTDPDQPYVRGSSGRALPHLRIAILDEAGRELPPGQEGEIVIGARRDGYWAQVYTPALGYWNDAAATRALLRGGWMHTGDIGLLDERGELFVRDRRSDLIVRGGANVYPAEVEETLLQDRRVRGCAVVGVPDERLGEQVAVVLELHGAADVARDAAAAVAPAVGPAMAPDVATWQALYDHCLAHHARYKVPALWFAVPAMPRNAMNKIVKPVLKDLLAQGALGAPWVPPKPRRD